MAVTQRRAVAASRAAPSARPATVAKSPATLQTEVAKKLGVTPEKVTNRDVINHVTQGGAVSFAKGASTALAYGVHLTSLAAEPAAPFIAPSPEQLVARDVVDVLSSRARGIMKELPPDFVAAIQRHVGEIRTIAVKEERAALVAGKGAAEARALRQGAVLEELKLRRPILDKALAELNPPLSPKSRLAWDELRKEVDNPSIAEVSEKARRLAEEVFEETLDKVDAALDPARSAAPSNLKSKFMTWLKEDTQFAQRFLGLAGFYKGPADGKMTQDVKASLDAAADAHYAKFMEIRGRFGALDSRSEFNILTLLPHAQVAARETMKVLVADGKRSGLQPLVLWGTRTYAQQDKIFAQRTPDGKKVTNARGGQSNHNFGIAWDIGLFQGGKYLVHAAPYGEAGKRVKAAGIDNLEWGGDWNFVDKPHYQIKINGEGKPVSELRALFESGRELKFQRQASTAPSAGLSAVA